MVYKRIKRGGSSRSSEVTSGRGGPNDKGQFKKRSGNNKNIGEVTAKRMHDKLDKLKQKTKKDAGADDEIVSNDSDEFIDREPINQRHTKRNELLNDPFLQAAET